MANPGMEAAAVDVAMRAHNRFLKLHPDHGPRTNLCFLLISLEIWCAREGIKLDDALATVRNP